MKNEEARLRLAGVCLGKEPTRTERFFFCDETTKTKIFAFANKYFAGRLSKLTEIKP